jgi:isopenicillin N synthase-like dioxygenase
VRSPKGTFVNATPIEGTIVVNAIKSTKHRVVEPPAQIEDDGSESYPPRYSIAYFCNPNYDRMIQAIPGTYEESGRKYKDVMSGEYITGRLTATY